MSNKEQFAQQVNDELTRLGYMTPYNDGAHDEDFESGLSVDESVSRWINVWNMEKLPTQ